MTSSYEDQGTGYDPGAAGHERQGRASRPQHTDSDVTDEHVDLLAQTMCAAFHSDAPVRSDTINAPVWDGLSLRQRGNWRRAARAAMRTLQGNAHWLATTPAGRAMLETQKDPQP